MKDTLGSHVPRLASRKKLLPVLHLRFEVVRTGPPPQSRQKALEGAARAERAAHEMRLEEAETKLTTKGREMKQLGSSKWAPMGTTKPPPALSTLQELPLVPSPVTSLSELSYYLVAGYENGNIFVWDGTLNEQAPFFRVHGHEGPVRCCAPVEGLNGLVTAADDRLLKVWNPETFELRETYCPHDAPLGSMAVLAGDPRKGKLVLATRKGMQGVVGVWR